MLHTGLFSQKDGGREHLSRSIGMVNGRFANEVRRTIECSLKNR